MAQCRVEGSAAAARHVLLPSHAPGSTWEQPFQFSCLETKHLVYVHSSLSLFRQWPPSRCGLNEH